MTAAMHELSERELLDGVLELARLFDWWAAHFRPAKTKHGWRTPVQADGAGFPDLVLVRGGRLIFAELKSETGKLASRQAGWLDALGQVHGVEVYVWRPSDLERIAEVLR